MRGFAAGLVLAGIIFICGAAFALETTPEVPASPKTPSPAIMGKDLGQGYSLALEASPVTGVSDISQLNTYSLGLSFSKAGVAATGDRLKLEVTRPVSVPSDAGPALPLQRGDETDINIIYSLPLDETTVGSLSLSAIHDADNIQDRDGFAAILRLKHNF